MTEKEVEGLFTLAGFKIKKKWKLVNQYWGGDYTPQLQGESPNDMREYIHRAKVIVDNPWWLVRTSCDPGLIMIGWRTRVINIDWSDTPIRITGPEQLGGPDWVTWEPTMIHAWGEEEALKELKALRGLFKAYVFSHGMATPG